MKLLSRHPTEALWFLTLSSSLLCSLELCEWKGQNQRTLSVGWFPASLTAPSLPPAALAGSSAPNPAPTPAYISTPMKGSLQHTGHGDIKPERCWGTPEGQDESVMLLFQSSCLGSLVYLMSCKITQEL